MCGDQAVFTGSKFHRVEDEMYSFSILGHVFFREALRFFFPDCD